ncbi:MAG: bifunctional folylpolyglutamate synthase/dihydrofolate synthase [Planctomycetota bacterium]|nr:bifunctional folylpolyglutamate synthase/dihydrofolate synthase [Planctomycetota bacterium]MDA1161767.1 bifunctional folylpolyglutamate synthase/dihydrofolate synthase [Planctomycetota bacterium]
MQITCRDEAIAWLYGRIDYERVSSSLTASDFKLERMRNLLARLGNPQERVPVVHIAGTKGKGSTAALIDSVLQAAGYTVGLFTSPHIDRFEERIRISGQEISEPAMTTLLSRLATVSQEIDASDEGHSPTFFELTTALAWLWFAESNVDIAVLEVGLGGRLDSTNICRPEVSVITTISRDHTHILGTRLSEIAGEKAGIIKPNVPVVSGVENREAAAVISEVAGCLKAPLEIIGSDSTLPDVGVFSCESSPQVFGFSRHQLRNAAVANATVRQLQKRGWMIPEEAIVKGLRVATSPVRIEKLRENPTVIVDAAHNWISAGALVETLQDVPVVGKRVLIFGTSQDKDVAGLCRRLFPGFDAIILSKYESNLRGLSVDTLAEIAAAVTNRPAHIQKDPADAWQAALRICPQDGMICIAGSFFLAAEIRRIVVTAEAVSER